MTDFTNIDTNGLDTFGNDVANAATTFTEGSTTPWQNMSKATTLGMSGLESAVYAANRQGTVLKQFAAYYQDVVVGTTTLMKASYAMMANYVNADDAANDEMNQVTELFAPGATPPPSQEGEGEQPDLPDTPDAELPDPEPEQEPEVCENTAQNQVDNYNDQYNGDNDDEKGWNPGEGDGGSDEPITMAPGPLDGTGTEPSTPPVTV